MKRIIVTPAGRKLFLIILFNNLKKYRNQFDKWILWANTDVKKDLDYIHYLSETNDWIEYIPLDVKANMTWTIASFFKYTQDPDAMYLRLDDDICYVEPEAISNIFKYREQNLEPFLVYGNIINNAIINHINQEAGRLSFSAGINRYYALEYLQRNTTDIAINTHKDFIKKISENNVDKMKFEDKTIFKVFERVSINAVCWLGKDFKSFNGVPDFTGQETKDEEEFLSVTMPRRLGRPNELCGNSVFAHFSYQVQLKSILEDPEIYSFYLSHSLS